VRVPFPLPRADKAVAQDPGLVARPQRPEVPGQLRVQGAEVLGPQILHEPPELCGVQAEDRGDLLLRLRQRDRANIARPRYWLEPGGHVLRPAQPEPPGPALQPVRRRVNLEHTANIKDDRTDRHQRILAYGPRRPSRRSR